jgi:hypothetical protein
VNAILSDICTEAQVRILVAVLNSPSWQELWSSLNLAYHTFRDVRLAPETSDSDVWDFCQREQMVLITANRNMRGPDSLEATIRTRSTIDSLPVFTVADAEEIFHSRTCADRVVERMMERLLEIDKFRGTGRIWLP